MQSSQDVRPRFEFYPVDSPNLRTVQVERVPFTIGRGEEADLQIHSTSVSREHAQIVKVPTGYRLRDLGSTNGTTVNGQPVTDTMLQDGDTVRVADVELTYLCASMGRLQRMVTQPLANRKSSVITSGIPVELATTRALNEALLFQRVPLAWSNLWNASAQASEATIAEIGPPLAAYLQSCDTRDRTSVASRVEWLAWQLAAEQRTDRTTDAALLVRVMHRESMDGRLVGALESASDWLPAGCRLGVVVHWEWTTSSPECLGTCRQLSELGYMLAFNEFSSGGSCVEAMEDVAPDYLVFADQVISGVADQPRRLQRLEIVQAACDAIGIRSVLPAGTASEDRNCCRQLGVDRLQQAECTATPTPQPVAMA